MIDKLKPKHTSEIEYQLNMEFIDFINVRLEEVNIKRKYENNTYTGYKSNINIHMKEFFGSSKNTNENKETDNKEKEQINHKDKKKIQNEQYIYKVCEVTPETYTMKELNKLLEIVKNDVIEIPVFLAAYYGLRRSEVVGLKWSAIDFENDWIYINHTIVQVSGCAKKTVEGKMIAKDRTKSIHSNRKLPLYKEVKAVLLKKKERVELNKLIFKNCYNNTYSEYVCVKDDGDIIKPNHISHRFLKLIRRNKMKEIRFHDLRHTLGTELNANGVDLKVIGEFLGHGNLFTTKRYSHPDDRIKRNVASAYGNLIHNG